MQSILRPPLHSPVTRRRCTPPSAAPSAAAEELEVSLGGGRSLRLLRSLSLAGVDEAVALLSSDALAALRATELYGAGDVVWPASLALARLLVHCPSFVAGRTVLELGAGLGLPSCAAAAAGAASLVLVDRDAASLELARRSVALNAPAASLRLQVADFCAAPAACWHAADVGPDIILCSDVLYDAQVATGLARALAHLLRLPGGEGRRALLADETQRRHRDDFTRAADAEGLDVAETVLPGPEGCRLLLVTLRV